MRLVSLRGVPLLKANELVRETIALYRLVAAVVVVIGSLSGDARERNECEMENDKKPPVDVFFLLLLLSNSYRISHAYLSCWSEITNGCMHTREHTAQSSFLLVLFETRLSSLLFVLRLVVNWRRRIGGLERGADLNKFVLFWPCGCF